MEINMNIVDKIFNIQELKTKGIWFSGIEYEGEYKKWFSNGQLWIHCFCEGDKLHGEYKRWYSDGQLWEHSFYKDGKKIKDF